MSDSWNGIEHKCPCCGYEVKWNRKMGQFIKGDKSFIVIDCLETDKPKHDYDGYETVKLLGCPKCSQVSYVIW